ncbi:MAG: membrane integrity-associated transporter subunit PqiC [Deltaproteobacteria bacterium]|nr:membrane integrity-associated transporter subunit PqiC [Deltaproteobacteria bacterium]
MNKFVRAYCLPALCGLFGVFGFACASSSPQVIYYSLLDTAAQGPIERKNDQLVLLVGPVTIPDILNRSQIATGGKDGIFQRSEYHRWAGDLDREIARTLTEQLAMELGTEKVVLFPGDQRLAPNCQVLINVLEMGGNLGKEANMIIRWTLIDSQGKWGPVIRRSHFSEPLGDGGYNSWVKVQQHNIRRLGKEIAGSVKENMKLQ